MVLSDNLKDRDTTKKNHFVEKTILKNESVKHSEESCDSCELLGIPEKTNQMFSLVSMSGPSKETLTDMTFWEPLPPPPDTIELGNSGWTLLHTIAAYYPTKPNQVKQTQVKEFLHSFSNVYPCNYCAKDFQDILKKLPPKLESQEEFSQWLCDAHNQVNIQLGKPTFDCNLVNQRWKREKHH